MFILDTHTHKLIFRIDNDCPYKIEIFDINYYIK